jgi:hypothetical protein
MAQYFPKNHFLFGSKLHMNISHNIIWRYPRIIIFLKFGIVGASGVLADECAAAILLYVIGL